MRGFYCATGRMKVELRKPFWIVLNCDASLFRKIIKKYVFRERDVGFFRISERKDSIA